MKFTFFITLFLFYFTTAHGSDVIRVNNFNLDANCKIILNSYKDAFNRIDTGFIKYYSLTKEDYTIIINSMIEKKVECLKESDKNYNVELLSVEFAESIKQGVLMDSIVYVNKSEIIGCGNTKFIKINASTFFKNKSLELPFSLVLLETKNEYYKLLMQLLNYKSLKVE